MVTVGLLALSKPTVTITGPTSVASGSTNNYTLSVSVITAGNGGLDVAASAGTFAVRREA